MAVFAISDLHLSLNENTNKSMEVFGRRWQGYTEKLEKAWRALIGNDDTVVLAGDISWALSTEEAVPDLTFLNSLPGKKIVGKGNHDFWWQTMSKLRAFKEAHGLDTISFLYNNAYIAEDWIVCGTRGWFYDAACDNIPPETDFAKIVAREVGRLRLSLEEGKKLKALHPQKRMVVFLHFPVLWMGKRSEEILSVLKEYDIHDCYFGHVHGNYELPMEFEEDGIRFFVTSADFLHFTPKLVRSY